MNKILTLVVICGFCLEGFSQSRAQKKVPLVQTAPGGTPSGTETASPNTVTPAGDDFIIGPEDVLEINVWKEAEVTRKVTVRSDGKISIPLLGEVRAGGLTIKQLRDQITEDLTRFFGEPLVTVDLVEMRSQVVYVLGTVAKPGAYPLMAPLTIVDLLARAGGPAQFAKSKEIVVVHQENNVITRYRFDYESFFDGRNYQQNILLRNGDKVFVP